ncbi:MAG TPA: bifunctional chorismate mutase/prephenate dehydratase [Pyrinomonadaceae bacterium]|nr:bifunctional chorismate mutase/prephenate dehydratase [Pyrinomonadaceae bacterium]
MQIEDWRSEIDRLDEELLRLLNQRAQLALKVGELKKDSGLSVCNHTREREVIERMCSLNAGPLDDRAVVELYRVVIHEARRIQTRATAGENQNEESPGLRLQEKTRIAFQGEPGAFSEEAAVKLLGQAIALVPRPTFESLFSALGDRAADYILAPIENSLAGFVHACFDQLLESSLCVSAEVIIPISHYLVGCPGASFESIATVESHPVALQQCRRFLDTNPQLKRIVAEDTAGSVAQIIRAGDPTRAAIAGMRAVERYGGVVLREHVEDSTENYTRFFLLTEAAESLPDVDKMSLTIELPHQPGALHDALQPFAQRGIDLLKIEGRPVKGRPWEYCFYLELRGSENEREVSNALQELHRRRVETRILGSYRAAAIPSS